jgi:hypothetical protein
MKLEWPGINSKGTVLRKLAYESFHLSKILVLIDGIYFAPKEELHVTLIGEKVGSILQEKIKQVPSTNELLEHVFEDIDWSFKRSGPVHILSRLNNDVVQKSVIMLIDMPGMTTFYRQLKSYDLIPDTTPVPPAHVTLYTHNCPYGIGVPSAELLDSLSENTFSVAEFNKLMNAG